MPVYKVYTTIAVWFCLIFSGCGSVYLNTISAAEQVHICSTEWEPFIIKRNDQFFGTHVDIARRAFQRIGLEMSLEFLPWKRCLKMAEEGRMDGVLGTSYKKDRATYLLYPETPIEKVEYVFLTKKGSAPGWNAARDFTQIPQPIITPLGWSVSLQLAQEAGIVHLAKGKTPELGIQQLLKGRVKTVVLSRDRAKIMLSKQSSEKQFEILAPPYQQAKPYYLTISKRYKGAAQTATELATNIDIALKELTQNGQ